MQGIWERIIMSKPLLFVGRLLAAIATPLTALRAKQLDYENQAFARWVEDVFKSD